MKLLHLIGVCYIHFLVSCVSNGSAELTVDAQSSNIVSGFKEHCSKLALSSNNECSHFRELLFDPDMFYEEFNVNQLERLRILKPMCSDKELISTEVVLKSGALGELLFDLDDYMNVFFEICVLQGEYELFSKIENIVINYELVSQDKALGIESRQELNSLSRWRDDLNRPISASSNDEKFELYFWTMNKIKNDCLTDKHKFSRSRRENSIASSKDQMIIASRNCLSYIDNISEYVGLLNTNVFERRAKLEPLCHQSKFFENIMLTQHEVLRDNDRIYLQRYLTRILLNVCVTQGHYVQFEEYINFLKANNNDDFLDEFELTDR
ncbi:hypothetical protein [Hirschia maritima]|uniref:hypothetical protein n=1 Tax=Hirschia maritima TaxID=1121961 RepID=UPI0003751BE4|nr:hypothetical protein [Hirschia maritima]